MTWLKWVAVAAGALLAVFALLAAFGAWHWKVATRALIERLEAARRPALPSRFTPECDLVGLPSPVRRFFRAVLVDGAPLVAALRLEHRGTFNLAAEGPDRWVPFTSTQHVTTRRPGFVWDARMAMAPGLAVRVHDAYVAGEGMLHPAVLGLVPLIDLSGSSPEPGGLAHGELMRFVAESAWYPTALLPSQGARWTAIDENSAQVALSDGPVGVSLLMRFDPSTGLIDSLRAQARGRIVGKDVVMTQWEGRWWDYAEHSGMKVPMSGEVAWSTPDGTRAYWRGTVTSLTYEFMR